MKRCSVCGVEKPDDAFSPRTGAGYKPGALRGNCRACGSAAYRKRYWEDPERFRQERRAYCAANKEHVRDIDRRHHYKVAYGITEDEFEALLKEQHGCCAACGTSEPMGPGKRLCVDHAHDETRRVRGLLCQRCNTAIGLLGDDPQRARDLADYLERVR